MNLATDQISVRVEHQLKVDAESVLNKLGLKTSDAIRMFLKQICLTQSLPLAIKLPNKLTQHAIEAGERGEVTKVSNEEFDKMLGM